MVEQSPCLASHAREVQGCVSGPSASRQRERRGRTARAIEGGGETSRPFVHKDPLLGALDRRRGGHINTI